MEVQLTIRLHWLRKWHGADQVTSHYLNQLYAVLWLHQFTITQTRNPGISVLNGCWQNPVIEVADMFRMARWLFPANQQPVSEKHYCLHQGQCFVVITRKSLRPRQNGRQFPDDIFKCIFLTENVIISIEISLKFVLKGSINNIPTLVQIMAWRRQGDRPLSETMLVRSLVTRPQ